MKNRCLLLLLTLITGLATEVAQASDSFKELKELASLPIVYKAVESALPKEHTAAKMSAALYAPPARLTQDEQMREFTYEITHYCLSEDNIKPEYANWHLKTAENLMLAEGKKYDPNFASRFQSWGLSIDWGLATRNSQKIYKMPAYCMINIIQAESGSKFDSEAKAGFHHERGHDYLNHFLKRRIFLGKMVQKDNFVPFYLAETKEEFLQIPNKKELLEDLASYHYFYVEQEKEADAFIPNEPELLAAEAKYYAIKAQNPTPFSPSHPSNRQRAEFFRNRFKKITKLRNEKLVDFAITLYAGDFLMKTPSDTNIQQNSHLFPDEYSVYLALKPLILEQLQ